MSTEEILSEFYEEELFTLDKDSVKVELVPERLRGETLPVDIKVKVKYMLRQEKELLLDILKN
jgi:DNA-directed RNA polymerase subunit beta